MEGGVVNNGVNDKVTQTYATPMPLAAPSASRAEIAASGDVALARGGALAAQLLRARRVSVGDEGFVLIQDGAARVAIMVRVDEAAEYDGEPWVHITNATIGSAW